MYRYTLETLKLWKANPKRKPLIIRGARQVGKTWLMKEFGKISYEHCVYFNFEGNPTMTQLFTADLNPARIIDGLELYVGHKIVADNTLIIFDEIQEVPQALTSLKYFSEEMPQYDIICAGSLLGIAMHQETSFPVGKVEFLNLYPLCFNEFLLAQGKQLHVSLLEKADYELITAVKSEYIDLLKQYYIIGGMPEVVSSYTDIGDYSEAAKIQKSILEAYELDFSKHAPFAIVGRIRMLWNNIPCQLAKENKKFIYQLIKEGARAREYETALLWLLDCGLVHQVFRTDAIKLPLKAYADLKAFKLFMVDVGLLSCMAGLNQTVLLNGNTIFSEFKGALTEQYVMQQLLASGVDDVYYWTNQQNTAEVDFLLDAGAVVPLEAKAETNLKSKSLRAFVEKFSCQRAIRLSMADYKQQDWLLNLPLYAITNINDHLK